MSEAFDVAIIGGGVIGSAIAYFLRRNSSAHVIVLERDPSYRRASSALSASSIRQQFSTAENIRMSRFGIEFLRNVDAHLSVDEPVLLGLVERGYLYLAPLGCGRALESLRRAQSKEGVDVVGMDAGELGHRFSWLCCSDIERATLGLSGEGWFDGYALMQGFRRKARALGAEFAAEEAVRVTLQRRRVTSVTTAGGRKVRCAAMVNAAGPWAHQVAAMAGVALPVEARRRSVFVFDARQALAGCPLVIDTTGVWFRPEGAHFLAGAAPSQTEDKPGLPLEPDHRQFEDLIWPALAHRVPAFAAIKAINAWAGYYEYNTFDQNAILGGHPEISNLYFANGFSGHGIQHAPAVGRAMAELIIAGRYLSLDLSVFGFERLLRNTPVREQNIIG
jgi:glycine/D-amino acid oxidase-like deaminating enzyme